MLRTTATGLGSADGAAQGPVESKLAYRRESAPRNDRTVHDMRVNVVGPGRTSDSYGFRRSWCQRAETSGFWFLVSG